MRVSGEAAFISAKTGKRRDGADWYLLKFLDNDSDEFFSIFVDDDLFNTMKSYPKHSPVLLTLNLTPGLKYFSLENLELIEQ